MAHELPGPEIRFAYAESPAKQWRDSDVRDTAHNPNELRQFEFTSGGVCGSRMGEKAASAQQPQASTARDP